MFDGMIMLPPVLLFMLVTPPVLHLTEEGELAVIIGLVCAAAHFIGHTRGKGTTALVTGALVYMLVDNARPWYMSFKIIPTALLCAAAASLVYDELNHAQQDAHVVRKLAYKVVVSFALIMAAVYTNALVTLMKDYRTLTLILTTTRNCTEEAVEPGFILTDSSFSANCPTRVWEYLRKDILLLVQAYVLYTLTTAMQHDMARAKGGSIRSLTVVECFSWTLASVMQFNDLVGCYRIGAATATLTSIAVVCHILRAKDSLAGPHLASGTHYLSGLSALSGKLKL